MFNRIVEIFHQWYLLYSEWTDEIIDFLNYEIGGILIPTMTVFEFLFSGLIVSYLIFAIGKYFV